VRGCKAPSEYTVCLDGCSRPVALSRDEMVVPIPYSMSLKNKIRVPHVAINLNIEYDESSVNVE
jgi:hypothetical protein